MTRYAYDETTFRLKRMRSERADPTPSGYTYSPDGTTQLQDINYSLRRRRKYRADRRARHRRGHRRRRQLSRTFDYDALYRLTLGDRSRERRSRPTPGSTCPTAATPTTPPRHARYNETYAYDAVGRLTQLTHNYGRRAPVGARLHHRDDLEPNDLDDSAQTPRYTYDASGNLLHENTERHLEWDFAGRMRAFRNQVVRKPGDRLRPLQLRRRRRARPKGGDQVEHETPRTVYVDGVFEHQQGIESG